MKFAVIVMKLLVVSALFLVSNYNLHLADQHERQIFLNLYSSWMGELYQNLRSMTGYVVKFEWLPSNNLSSEEIENLQDVSFGGG